jgi:hypothetical protein
VATGGAACTGAPPNIPQAIAAAAMRRNRPQPCGQGRGDPATHSPPSVIRMPLVPVP